MRPQTPNAWADLRPRVISGVAMVAVGALAIWAGGVVFAALVVLVCGLMVWELARMTAAGGAGFAVPLAVLAALCLAVELRFDAPVLRGLLAVPALVGAVGARRFRGAYVGYAVLVMLTGHALVVLRDSHGLAVIVWLVLVVAVSDLAGYFVGRTLGGPKFWPQISPKKTWSGTVAGWVGAGLVGLGFALAGLGGGWLVALSPLVAFAGQMGDIAESWIKRHTGVKDSSNLIPGHGGVMDRFDALAAAVVGVYLLSLLADLPFTGV